MLANILAGALLARNYNKKKSSGALNAPEAILPDVDTGKYENVSNPYRDLLENNSYQQTFWDKVGNWIGFNTKEDNYRLELERLARETDFKLQLQNVTDHYNSEASQAARQREAGINPDLNGVSSESATSSGPSTPDSSALSNIESLTTADEVMPIIGSISNIVTTAIGNISGLVGLFQNVNARKLANDASMIDNIKSAYDFGYHQSEQGFKSSDINSILEKTDLSDYDLVDGSYVHKKTGELLIPDSVITADYDTFIDKFNLRNNRNTKNYFNSFKRGFLDYINGQVGVLKQSRNENEITKERVTGKKNEILGFDSDTIDSTFEPIMPMLKESFRLGYETDLFNLRFNNLYYKVRNAVTLASDQNARNQYGYQYYSALDASLAATNENTSNQVQQQYLSLAQKRNFGKLKAEIEEMQIECDKLVTEWQSNFVKQNYKMSKILGENNFGQYILQSVIGDVNGNLLQRINTWQQQTLNRIGQVSNIISPFVSSSMPSANGYTFSTY